MKGNMTRTAIVYLAVNRLNGKRYIGVTSRSIGARKREHACHALKNVNQGAFYRAIRKYGIDAFDFRILLECEDCHKALREEIRLIAEMSPEYNSTAGGDGQRGRTMSAESRRKISEFHKGKAWHKGRKHSDKTRELLRANGLAPEAVQRWQKYASMGPQAMARPVECLDDGRIFESASEAARVYGVARSALIELCLGKKYRKSVGGLRFAYVDTAS